MTDASRWVRWGLLGRCEAMERLRGEILRYAPGDLSIHLHGETGTGKERAARALHAASGRRGRFVPFNAAGVSDELVDAELFGHTRGAFTGAVAAREGFVARAESGTLFLDEVAELSPKAQVKLLRFLEEREYHRLGESAPRRADVRVVSAANVDLRGRVERGLFREDLFYRIVGHCIRLPPLRERGGDVLMLVHHFLRREAGGEPPRLSVDAERAIARFPWPGNVRQLANEVKRLVLNAHGGVVRHSDLAEEIRERGAGGRGALHAARDEFERRFVREALERNGGNRTATAAELQISRQALVAKMRRLGIVAPRDERRGPTPPGPSAPTAPRGPTPLLG